jgi:hypothetical protein
MEKTAENQKAAISQWQTLSHKVVVYGVHLTMDEIRTQNYHDYSCDGHWLHIRRFNIMKIKLSYTILSIRFTFVKGIQFICVSSSCIIEIKKYKTNKQLFYYMYVVLYVWDSTLIFIELYKPHLLVEISLNEKLQALAEVHFSVDNFNIRLLWIKIVDTRFDCVLVL